MTDSAERIAALETNMTNVLATLAKREDYQASVLKQLTIIEMKQDQFLTYQKHCDGERGAHASRIAKLEDESAYRKQAKRMLLFQAGLVSAVISCLASLATVISTVRH